MGGEEEEGRERETDHRQGGEGEEERERERERGGGEAGGGEGGRQADTTSHPPLLPHPSLPTVSTTRPSPPPPLHQRQAGRKVAGRQT